MGRFKKFIEKEVPNNNTKRREETGNAFKRNKRNKRIYKSKISKEDFLNKMKKKGATLSGFSLMDAINTKSQTNKYENKYDTTKEEEKKTMKKKEEFVDNSSEKEKEAMRNYVLARYYEEEDVEDEEDDTFTQKNLSIDKKDDIISF